MGSNVSVAVAAERFDPVLGWLDTDVGGGEVHVFSSLAPAAFLPTCHCTEVPPELCLAVRSLSEAHAASAAEDAAMGVAPIMAPPEDFAMLQAFMAQVAQHLPAAPDGSADGGSQLS